MNKNIKYFILIILAVFFFFIIARDKISMTGEEPKKIHFSEFKRMLNPGTSKNISMIFSTSKKFKGKDADYFILKISPKKIEGRYLDAGIEIDPNDDLDDISSKTIPFEVIIIPRSMTEKIYEKMDNLGIIYKNVNPDESSLFSTLFQMLPFILIIGLLWMFMMRQIQNTGNRAMAFGKSKARLNSDTKKKITFNDVAGCDEAKAELIEIVDFLKEPKKFQAIGARIPTGVLLVGPPGTGKTLLARAISGEASVPFYSISGSDFVEMFVGVGASRVRDLFSQAKKNAPCIIFIDEIDAVGRLRGAGLGGGHDEREQTLNQLLVDMDGFEENESVIVVAATNRPDVLDPALLRPGRFDRQVVVDLPDIKGREAILKIHARKVPLTSDVSLNAIARGTPGFTGADLRNLINEAALLTARRNKRRLTQQELDDAKDKVMMGPERRSFLISPREKEVIAYHESGHAMLGMLLPHADPVHKVTIIPRGRALGITMQLPEDDKHIQPKTYWLDKICVLMGGYVAEELMFNDTATGSSSDIQLSTNITRRMVCEWGMSERLGTISYSNDNESVFLGRDLATMRNYSDDTAAAIDDEVKLIVREQLDRARKLIIKNKDTLEKIAKALLAHETLNAEDLNSIVGSLASDSQKRLTESPPPKTKMKKEKEKEKEKEPHTGSDNDPTPEPVPAT